MRPHFFLWTAGVSPALWVAGILPAMEPAEGWRYKTAIIVSVDFDTTVKLQIYQTIAETTRAPSAAEIAKTLGAPQADVEAAFERLNQKRLLVPEPDDPSKIRMAPPFSGVETTFPVEVGTKTYFANCVWDALGVAAALRQNAVIRASDGQTNDPITLEVKNENVLAQECVIHFAVPAALWWKDVIYT